MLSTVQHICIADDDEDDYFLFNTALKEVNDAVKLTYFNSCAGLLAHVRNSDETPDIIVLDMNMPGNDGCRCLSAIKDEARYLFIPVIIYSTTSTPSLIKIAQDCGAYTYLIKPSSIDLIKVLIQELLVIPLPEQALLPQQK